MELLVTGADIVAASIQARPSREVHVRVRASSLKKATYPNGSWRIPAMQLSNDGSLNGDRLVGVGSAPGNGSSVQVSNRSGWRLGEATGA
jgi:hypothetical protein